MINKNEITIIVPTLDSERNAYALNECLTSLFESNFPRENIIIALNGEKNNKIKTKGTKLVWVRDQGQCKSTNAAVATVNTPWIMVTNDDHVYPPNWFERLTDFSWFGKKDVVCVSPQLVEPNDGAPTFIKYFCGGVGGDWDKEKFMEFAKNRHIATPGKWRPGFNLPFLMKKEVWDMVGGYDVELDPFSSNSDSDLEYKLKLAGVEMWQNTNCPVYHFSQTSGIFHPSKRSYWQKNWDYFIEKWGFERASSPEIWDTSFEIDYDKLKYRPKWMKLPQENDSKVAK
ncbi:MAG TPA: glycosyltransferase [bacterium]|nr:glycosyltransferase [bacterium]